MSRKPSRTEKTISLFPFLSVLACVIGTLTLMIASLALGNLVENHSVERAQDYDLCEMDNREAEDEVAQLEEQIAEAEALTEELEQVRQELNHLEALLKDTEEQEETRARLCIEVERLSAQISKMERELERLKKSIKERQMLCEELKEADSHMEKPRILLQPGGSGQGLTPHFVECTADSLVMHSDLLGSPKRIERAKDKDFNAFSEFLDKVRSKENATVIFLIRPDGVPVYDDLYRAAEKVGVRNGKLSLPGQGEIDFSLFRHS